MRNRNSSRSIWIHRRKKTRLRIEGSNCTVRYLNDIGGSGHSFVASEFSKKLAISAKNMIVLGMCAKWNKKKPKYDHRLVTRLWRWFVTWWQHTAKPTATVSSLNNRRRMQPQRIYGTHITQITIFYYFVSVGLQSWAAAARGKPTAPRMSNTNTKLPICTEMNSNKNEKRRNQKEKAKHIGDDSMETIHKFHMDP